MTTLPAEDAVGPEVAEVQAAEPRQIAPVRADPSQLHATYRRRDGGRRGGVACDHRQPDNATRRFCVGCGAELAQPSTPLDPNPPDPPPGRWARFGPLGLLAAWRARRQPRFLPFETVDTPEPPPEPGTEDGAPPAAPAPAAAAPARPAPAARARPAPPEPVDSLRAGLARPPRPRVGRRWLLAALALVLVALLVLFRTPLVNSARTFLEDLGIGRGAAYDRLLVQSVWADEIVPGRSGRYVADGLATTYWAFEWRQPPPAGSLKQGSVELFLAGKHGLDQIGVSPGIQNGDAPFSANPRPKVLLVTLGTCPATGSCEAQQQRVVLRDDPGFHRYPLDLPDEARLVTVQVVDVYPSLVSPSVRPNPDGGVTVSSASAAWAALTEVVLFERD